MARLVVDELERKTAGAATTHAPVAAATAAAKSSPQMPTSTNLRGKRIDAVVAAQASHSETQGGPKWAEDCGLCALKNLTGEPSFTLSDVLAVARPMQAKLAAARSAGRTTLVEHMQEGKGNFSGGVLCALLEKHGYVCVGGLDGACERLEFFAHVAGSRLVGCLWRTGGDGQTQVTSGHWLCASYVHDAASSFESRVWVRKDSCGSTADTKTTESIMADLRSATADGRDFLVVVDTQ